jgi:hypothetical protein
MLVHLRWITDIRDKRGKVAREIPRVLQISLLVLITAVLHTPLCLFSSSPYHSTKNQPL